MDARTWEERFRAEVERRLARPGRSQHVVVEEVALEGPVGSPDLVVLFRSSRRPQVRLGWRWRDIFGDAADEARRLGLHHQSELVPEECVTVCCANFEEDTEAGDAPPLPAGGEEPITWLA